VREALTHGSSTQDSFSQEQEHEVAVSPAHGAGCALAGVHGRAVTPSASTGK